MCRRQAIETIPAVGADFECGIKEVNEVATGDETRAASAEQQKLSAAHIRTAAILFVVTAVFMLTFAPAFFMSVVLPYSYYSPVIFNTYFFNSVVNPVIYSFMNVYFRREMEGMFCNFATRAISRWSCATTLTYLSA